MESVRAGDLYKLPNGAILQIIWVKGDEILSHLSGVTISRDDLRDAQRLIPSDDA